MPRDERRNGMADLDLDDAFEDFDHEELLQALVQHLLATDDLDELCADAGLPVLVDADGRPVRVTAARSYRDAGVLTMNCGVWLELSDGSAFGLTVTVSRRPTIEVTLRRR
jgi:hypothetical protein